MLRSRLSLIAAICLLLIGVSPAFAYTEFRLEYPNEPQAHHEFRYINESAETGTHLQYSRVWKLRIELENDFWTNANRNSFVCKIQYADADGDDVELRYAEFPNCDATRSSFAGGTEVSVNTANRRIDIEFGTESATGRPLISGINTSRSSSLSNAIWRTVWFDIDFTSNDVDQETWRATSVGKAYVKNLAYRKTNGPWSELNDYHWVESDRVRTIWEREEPPPPPPNIFIQKRVRNVSRGEATFRAETHAEDGEELEYHVRVTNAQETHAEVNITDNLLCTLLGRRSGDNGGRVTRTGVSLGTRLAICNTDHDVRSGEPYVVLYRAIASANGIPEEETSTVINTATIEDIDPFNATGVGRNDDARVIIEAPTQPEVIACESLTATPEEIPANTAAGITVTTVPTNFDGEIRYQTATGTFTANTPSETGNPLETPDRTVNFSGAPSGIITISTVGPGAHPACTDTIVIRPEEEVPFCGDGTIDPGETCDDGNNVNGDGCTATCELEPPGPEPFCGDGTIDPGETCDDGNNVNGDGCTETCALEDDQPPGGGGPICGNSLLEIGEECDDGNTVGGDGCSATCTLQGGPGGGGPGGGGPGGGPGGGGPGGGGPGGPGSITQGGGQIPEFPGILGFPGITTDALTKGARFLTNTRRATTPELLAQNNLAEFTIVYTSPPNHAPYNVTIKDTVSGGNRIPGNQGGEIRYVGGSQTVNLPRCDGEDIIENCYQGEINRAQGVLIQNIAPNIRVEIIYRGTVHSSIQCENEDAQTGCLGEKFVNTARSESDLGTREASAELLLLCPYLLTRSGGDVLFEKALDAGTDVSCINPTVKNSEGLVIQPLDFHPLALPSTGIGELLSAFTRARRLPAFTPSALNLCGPDSVVPRFSSFICEIETEIETRWQRKTIAERLEEHAARVSRGSAVLRDTISDLNQLPDDRNPETRVYKRATGDLRIVSPLPLFENGAQTIIVENGNLLIDGNIRYAPYKAVEPKNAPALAFIVLNGDIIIAPTVTRIDGVLVAKNGVIRSAGNQSSGEQLEIQGAVFGDIEPLAKKRTFVGDPVQDGGAIVIRYDARLLLNTPPGLQEFVNLTHEKVAR